MEEKDFDGWIRVKENLHFFGTFRSIKEGEIWWCSVGENVGVEIDGKQELFLRPVLIMKKTKQIWFHGYTSYLERTRRAMVYKVYIQKQKPICESFAG